MEQAWTALLLRRGASVMDVVRGRVKRDIVVSSLGGKGGMGSGMLVV